MSLELITKGDKVFPWHVICTALNDKRLPDEFKAKLCRVFTGM